MGEVSFISRLVRRLCSCISKSDEEDGTKVNVNVNPNVACFFACCEAQLESPNFQTKENDCGDNDYYFEKKQVEQFEKTECLKDDVQSSKGQKFLPNGGERSENVVFRRDQWKYATCPSTFSKQFLQSGKGISVGERSGPIAPKAASKHREDE